MSSSSSSSSETLLVDSVTNITALVEPESEENFYETQRNEIHEIFFENCEWAVLVPRLEEALRDEFLPLADRAEFEAMAASPCPYEEAQEHITRALEAWDQLRRQQLGTTRWQADESVLESMRLINSIVDLVATRHEREIEGIPDELFEPNAAENNGSSSEEAPSRPVHPLEREGA